MALPDDQGSSHEPLRLAVQPPVCRHSTISVDSLPLAAYVCNSQGLLTHWNSCAVELWGREPSHAKDTSPYWGPCYPCRVDGSPLTADDCPIVHVIRSGVSKCNIEAVIQRFDGLRRSVLINIQLITEQSGMKAAAVIVLQDITRTKRIEEALQESEARLRATLHRAAVGVAHVGMDNRTLWANPGLCDILGYNEEELRSKTFLDLTHPDDIGADLAMAGKLLAGEIQSYRIEKRYIHKTGSIVWGELSVSLVHDAAGHPKYAVGVLIDITERKQATVRLEAILASINDHLVCYDREWRYTFVNDKAAEVLGKRKEDLLGRIIWDVFPNAVGNQYYQELHRAFASQEIIRSEHYYEPFGKWFENHIYPSSDGVTVFTSDITWRKRLESELRETNQRLTEADKRKDVFLATLAHELRNPLAPICNSLHILKQPSADARTVQRARDMIDRQVRHLVRLVDDLLNVARIVQGKIELRKEDVDLRSVVARAIEIARPLIDVNRHRLEVFIPQEPLIVAADPIRLAQVFGNVLTNAAKYTDPGGEIVITARKEPDKITVSVRDNGMGIAPDMLSQVFDLFVQGHRDSKRPSGGLGIGLTLVKNLVEMHGGTVTAHSAGLGKGCEVIVRLPAAMNAGATRSNDDEQTMLSTIKHRLLVVDDNEDAAVSLAALLGAAGHDVRVAYDGASAIEIAKSFLPALVLLDLGMPGMTGYDVANALRLMPELKKLKIAALTGWGQDEDRRKSVAAGCHYHLVKPPDLALLKTIISDLKSES